MWFYVKWPAGGQLNHSWWSNVGSMVDIHALGFRGTVDKGEVTISNTGYWKSSRVSSPPSQSTSFYKHLLCSLSQAPQFIGCIKPMRHISTLKKLIAQWRKSYRYQCSDGGHSGSLE